MGYFVVSRELYRLVRLALKLDGSKIVDPSLCEKIVENPEINSQQESREPPISYLCFRSHRLCRVAFGALMCDISIIVMVTRALLAWIEHMASEYMKWIEENLIKLLHLTGCDE